MNRFDADFARRVFGRYGVIPVLSKDVPRVYVKGVTSENETFSQWCLRVFGMSHKDVQLLRVCKVSPRKGMKRVVREYGDERIRSIFRAEARHAQSVVSRGIRKNCDVVDSRVLSESTTRKSDLLDLVGTSVELSPEHVKEYFERFIEELPEEVEWSQVFIDLVQRYAKLAAGIRKELDRKEDRKELQGNDALPGGLSDVEMAAGDFKGLQSQMMPGGDFRNNPGLNDFRKDYLIAGAQMFIFQSLVELTQAFEDFLEVACNVPDAMEALDGLRSQIELEEYELRIPPLDTVDDEIDHDRRMKEEASVVEYMMCEVDGIYSILEEVQAEIEDVINVLPGALKKYVNEVCEVYFSSMKSLLQVVCEPGC